MTPEINEKINNLPDTAGVYIFKDSGESIIYVGKAKNLKKRVKNHFQKPDQHVFDFIPLIAGIDFIETSGEKEALLLEQQFIKKFQPRWNVEWKDDKNYFYIAVSNGAYPRIYLTHQPKSENPAGSARFRLANLQSETLRGAQDLSNAVFGPFVNGRELKSFLKEIRKALPYRTCRNLPKEPCFYQSLGLCAAPCVKKNRSYLKIAAILELLFKIYRGDDLRLECYDISNLSGTLAVGSLVVFQNGRPHKNSYRKFKIKTVAGQNDVASLKEILLRRLAHPEWPMPDLIILDGGKGQLKAARGVDIPVIALAKIGKNDGKLFTKFSKNYAQLSKLPPNLSNLFLQIRDEAHRFAIGYNKLRRFKKINYPEAEPQGIPTLR